MRKKYEHSAYWYAYHKGWTYSEASTYAGRYFDQHSYRPRMKKRSGGIWPCGKRNDRMPRNWEWPYEEWADSEWCSKDWFKWRNATKELDSTFNPLLFAAAVAIDIGVAMRDEVRRIADPIERDRMKRELMRDLRRVRRPFYYAREVERRRNLAIERRKLHRRRTAAPMPTAEELLSAWNERKSSREAMIKLGGMLHDLECYVDNCLRFDEIGNVVGRNGGIRGWLKENLPELSPKYKTLMRYKALAVRLRQVTETKDPTPTSKLLAKPLHKVVKTILADEEPVFSRVFKELEHMLSPQTVLLSELKCRNKRRRQKKR